VLMKHNSQTNEGLTLKNSDFFKSVRILFPWANLKRPGGFVDVFVVCLMYRWNKCSLQMKAFL
jgi:hypothetical protein